MGSLSCLKSQPSFTPSFPPLVHLFTGFVYGVVYGWCRRTGDVGTPSAALPSAYKKRLPRSFVSSCRFHLEDVSSPAPFSIY